jgi:GAF domain-containing protein
MPGSERYTEQDKELLQYVCAQVATAIERKQCTRACSAWPSTTN